MGPLTAGREEEAGVLQPCASLRKRGFSGGWFEEDVPRGWRQHRPRALSPLLGAPEEDGAVASPGPGRASGDPPRLTGGSPRAAGRGAPGQALVGQHGPEPPGCRGLWGRKLPHQGRTEYRAHKNRRNTARIC